MKVSIDITCTPEEARRFFGLPDVQEVQKVMMTTIQERMAETIQTMNADDLAKVWLPTGMPGWENLQKAFATGFASAAKDRDDT